MHIDKAIGEIGRLKPCARRQNLAPSGYGDIEFICLRKLR